MRVLSAAEMQACDRATTERFGIPSLELMRGAAASIAAFVRQQYPRAKRVTVLCGRGNNGGDGMMAARLLGAAGLEVTTLLLGAPAALKGDAAQAWQELAACEHDAIHAIDTAEELAAHGRALEADVILDALVGTGFAPPLKGLALAALDWIKGSPAAVVGGRSAFRLGGGCDQRGGGGAGVSRRCGHHVHSAQAGSCFWAVDAGLGAAGGGGADWLAGRSDCFNAGHGVGRVGTGADARSTGHRGQ